MAAELAIGVIKVILAIVQHCFKEHNSYFCKIGFRKI
jgi:hypothetical protein